MTLGDRVMQLHAEGKSDAEIGSLIGKSKDQVYRIRKKVSGGVPQSEATFTVEPDNPDAATLVSDSIKSLDELLERANVDLSVWTVERHVANAWTLAGGEQAYQVKAWLKRTAGAEAVREVWEDFLADAWTRSPHVNLRKQLPLTGLHMAEFCIFDAHIGKLGCADEVGENFDIKIARERIRFALNDLHDQIRPYPLDEILLPWGNDLQHYDTLTGLTTAGTPQDRDSRYAKMFRTACEISRYAIDQAAAIAPTKVLIVPGNHDAMSTWNLGEYLIAWYRNDERVTIDNEPIPRKFHAYGNTLLGFCHGNEEPLAQLPTIMPVEVPHLWGASKYREWHIGHTHTSKATDSKPVAGNKGVRVRTIQSLSGLDNWHKKKGYVGEPGCAEAFVWSKDRGLRANLFSNRLVEAA